jgi:hypothetical protein
VQVRSKWAFFLLAATAVLFGQRADAMRTPLTDVRAAITQPQQLTAPAADAATPADAWLVESITPLGHTDDGQPIVLISLLIPTAHLAEHTPASTRAGPYAAPKTHTRGFYIGQPPLGLAPFSYKYGGGDEDFNVEMFVPEFAPTIQVPIVLEFNTGEKLPAGTHSIDRLKSLLVNSGQSSLDIANLTIAAKLVNGNSFEFVTARSGNTHIIIKGRIATHPQLRAANYLTTNPAVEPLARVLKPSISSGTVRLVVGSSLVLNTITGMQAGDGLDQILMGTAVDSGVSLSGAAAATFISTKLMNVGYSAVGSNGFGLAMGIVLAVAGDRMLAETGMRSVIINVPRELLDDAVDVMVREHNETVRGYKDRYHVDRNEANYMVWLSMFTGEVW